MAVEILSQLCVLTRVETTDTANIADVVALQASKGTTDQGIKGIRSTLGAEEPQNFLSLGETDPLYWIATIVDPK